MCTDDMTATCMEFVVITINEISQAQKDKYHVFSLISWSYKSAFHEDREKICCYWRPRNDGRGMGERLREVYLWVQFNTRNTT